MYRGSYHHVDVAVKVLNKVVSRSVAFVYFHALCGSEL